LTQMAHRGLSAKEVAGALISMMARSDRFHPAPYLNRVLPIFAF
jgi:hypothetical protein